MSLSLNLDISKDCI